MSADILLKRSYPGDSEIPEGYKAYEVMDNRFFRFSAHLKLLKNLAKIGKEEFYTAVREIGNNRTTYIGKNGEKDAFLIVQEAVFLKGFLINEKDEDAGMDLIAHASEELGLSYLVRD